MKRYLDAGSLTVIIVTFILFGAALWTKGFTHDLLLEAGVLLVSIKLIMMAYRTSVFYNNIAKDLDNILRILSENRVENDKKTS